MDLRALIESMPSPVAQPCALALYGEGEGDVRDRLWALHFGGLQLVRLSVLAVVQGYLDHPAETADLKASHVVAIGKALAMLRCPYYSSWIAVFNTLADRMSEEKVGIAPILALREIQGALKACPMIPAIGDEYAFAGAKSALPHYALLGLRNGLAHGGPLPSLAESERLVTHYLPALEAMVSSFALLGNCELRVREGAFEGSATRVRALRGSAHHAGVPTLLGDADEAWLDVFASSDLALRVPSGLVVDVAPMFARGPDSTVGMYEGHYLLGGHVQGTTTASRHVSGYVHYLGARHARWSDPAGVERLLPKLDARQVRWCAKLTPAEIADSLFHTSKGAFEALLDVKYFPAGYVERPDVARQVERFLKGASRSGATGYRNGLLLMGVAGSGKTAWSAHLAARWLRASESGDGYGTPREAPTLLLFLRGDMFLRGDRGMKEQEPATWGARLLPMMLERMGLPDREYLSFHSLLLRLDGELREDRVKDRRMIVLFDAVNEAWRAEELFQECRELLEAAAPYAWCRVIITVRREFLAVLREHKAGPNEKDPLFMMRPFLYEPDDDAETAPAPAFQQRRGRSDPVLELRLLGDDEPSGQLGEAGRAYEHFRREGIQGRKGCVTPWSEIGPETRELLRMPLFILLFHQSNSRCVASRAASPLALFKTYVDERFKEFGALESACLMIADRVLRGGGNGLTLEDAHQLRGAWERGRDVNEARFTWSPVEYAVEANVIRRSAGAEGGFVFVFEKVFEYLVFGLWKSQDEELSVPFLQARIAEFAERSENLGCAAFDFVFEELLNRGRATDWAALVDDAAPAALAQSAARTWAAAVDVCTAPADGGREMLLTQTAPGQVVGAFAALPSARSAALLQQLGDALSETKRQWKVLAYEAVRGIYWMLVQRGQLEFRYQLACSDQQLGSAIALAGGMRSVAAKDAAERARAAFSLLVQEEERPELLVALLAAEMNAASFFFGDDDADRIAALERARAYHERLVQLGWSCKPITAQLELDLASLLCESGAYTRAVELCERLRVDCLQITEDDGSRASLLASVEVVLGGALQGQGESSQAVAAFRRASELSKRAVDGLGCTERAPMIGYCELLAGRLLNRAGDPEGALDALERAHRAYAWLLDVEGRREFLDSLSDVAVEIGVARCAQEDLAEGRAAFERARAYLEASVSDRGEGGVAPEIASIDSRIGNLLRRQRNFTEASKVLERARAGLAAVVARRWHPEYASRLANVQRDLAAVSYETGDLDGAASFLEELRVLLLRPYYENAGLVGEQLAGVEFELGDLHVTRGGRVDATEAFTRARAGYARMIHEHGRVDLEPWLARSEGRLGQVLFERAMSEEGAFTEAIDALEGACTKYVALVERGQVDLGAELACTRRALGVALRRTGKLEEALAALEFARGWFEGAVEQGGVFGAAAQRAFSTFHVGRAQERMGRHEQAVVTLEQAHAQYRVLVEVEGRTDLAWLQTNSKSALALSLMSLSRSLRQQGAHEKTLSRVREARALFQSLIDQVPPVSCSFDLAFSEHLLGLSLRELFVAQRDESALAEALEMLLSARSRFVQQIAQVQGGAFGHMPTVIDLDLTMVLALKGSYREALSHFERASEGCVWLPRGRGGGLAAVVAEVDRAGHEQDEVTRRTRLTVAVLDEALAFVGSLVRHGCDEEAAIELLRVGEDLFNLIHALEQSIGVLSSWNGIFFTLRGRQQCLYYRSTEDSPRAPDREQQEAEEQAPSAPETLRPDTMTVRRTTLERVARWLYKLTMRLLGRDFNASE